MNMNMDVFYHPPKYNQYKITPKVKFKYPDSYYDIILTQQSLPINKESNYYYPIVNVSKKFEESMEKCRKKQKMKIKAIERTTISKNLSKNIIENYKTQVFRSRFLSDTSENNCRNNRRASELVDQLLFDIYGRSTPDQKFDTEYCSSTSTVFTDKFDEKLQFSRLQTKDTTELRILIAALKERVNYTGILLVKHLKKKDALKTKQDKICNVITAHLQAYSNRKSEDTSMKFSPNPKSGDSGFNQWHDAMKMVAKLPGGIPPEFRKKLWLALAEKHLQSKGVNWSQTEKICFNEWSNPDDSELGIQIVKDLHRTGCSLFCGAQGQENQVLLKRVLLAYARWNKNVGYCQGFNMLAALILQVMDKNETDSVKVMIYLIEGVLPESYFANNLRGLSVDMIVFRDLLKLRLPQLSKHLEALQNDAREGNSYEPPLTNVFTMQWFLTLFCNCLPQSTVLRVWDLIFLEGNEILLRTAIAIWEKLSDRILAVNSADEFYSIMGVLTREMLEFGLVDSNTLIKSIVAIGTCSELNDMRDKYLYNITPWTQSVQSAAKKGFKLFYSDDDDTESDYDEKAAVTAAYGINIGRKREKHNFNKEGTSIQPYTHHPDRERLALDISALKKQYAKLRERQRQAHIILQAACARQPIGQSNTSSPIAMNHLLLGKNAIVNSRGRRLGPPKGSIPPARIKEPSKKKEIDKPCETIHWKDTDQYKRRQSYTEETLASEETFEADSDSSSYSEEDQSSTSTELCDEPGRLSDFDSDEKVSDLEAKKKEETLEMKQEDVAKVTEIKSDVKELISDLKSDYIGDSEEISSKLLEEEKQDLLQFEAKPNEDNYNFFKTSEDNYTSYLSSNPAKTCFKDSPIEDSYSQFISSTSTDLLNKEETSISSLVKEEIDSSNNKNEFSLFSSSNLQSPEEICLQKEETTSSSFVKEENASSIDNKNEFSLFSSSNLQSPEKICIPKEEISKEESVSSIDNKNEFSSFLSSNMLGTEESKTPTTNEDNYLSFLSSNLLNKEDICFKEEEEEKDYSSFLSSNLMKTEDICLKKEETCVSSIKNEETIKPITFEDTSRSYMSSNFLSPDDICFKEKNIVSSIEERVTLTNKETNKSYLSSNLSPEESCFKEENKSSSKKEEIISPVNFEDTYTKYISSNFMNKDEICFNKEESVISSTKKEEIISPTNFEDTYTQFVSSNLMSTDKICFKKDESAISSTSKQEIVTPVNNKDDISSFMSSNFLNRDNICFKKEEASVSSSSKLDIVTPIDNKDEFSSFISSNFISTDNICFKKDDGSVSSPLKEEIITPIDTKDEFSSFISSNFMSTDKICYKKEDTSISPSLKEEIVTPSNTKDHFSSYMSSKHLSTENICFKEDDSSISSPLKEEIITPISSKDEFSSFMSSNFISTDNICFKKDDSNVSSSVKEKIVTPTNTKDEFSSYMSSKHLNTDNICFKKDYSSISSSRNEENMTPTNTKDKFSSFMSSKHLSTDNICFKKEDSTISSSRNEENMTPTNTKDEFSSFMSSNFMSTDNIDFKKEDSSISSLRNEENTTSTNIKTEYTSYISSNLSTSDEFCFKKPCTVSSNEDIVTPTNFKSHYNVSSTKNEDPSSYLSSNFLQFVEREDEKDDEVFDSFLHERSQISEDISSPDQRSSELRRHKSYEESSKKIEKSRIFKQQSFDINVVPTIETSLWKPYKIDEESPKEESEEKKTDLLTVEDKRLELGRRNSERALKIIQENSLILHRILQQQKSSEKEDSEDELSRSPISKTFLRSESLLSKDERTDEERSSINDEEELESGFSVSPALIEDEFKNEDTLTSKNEDYDLSNFISSIDSPISIPVKTYDDFSPIVSEEKTSYDVPSSILDSKIDDLSSASNDKYKEDTIEEISSKYTDNTDDYKTEDYQFKYTEKKSSGSYNLSSMQISSFSNEEAFTPDVSPKNLSCLQFTSFQTEIPCSSKFPPCNQEKQISPEKLSPVKTPKYLINLPTLSPPRRSVKSPLSPNRTFSPFPVQPTTRQPKELGVKLGIYKDPLKSPTK